MKGIEAHGNLAEGLEVDELNLLGDRADDAAGSAPAAAERERHVLAGS